MPPPLNVSGGVTVNPPTNVSQPFDVRPLVYWGRLIAHTTRPRLGSTTAMTPRKKDPTGTGIECASCRDTIATVASVGSFGITMHCPGCGYFWSLRDLPPNPEPIESRVSREGA